VIQANLITFLKAITGMSALVSSRIYWLDMPSGTSLPYVVVQQVAGLVDIAHDGSSGLQMGRFQVDCYGATWADAAAVRDLIEGALKGYKGTFGSGGTATTIDAVFPVNPIDTFESAVTPPQYLAQEDFEIHFRK
jgi:hypothetical protein